MKRKGFTLIELLVVIAIIGLLSTMAVVSLNGAREKARDAQRMSDVKSLSTLLEVEATDNAPGTAVAGCNEAHNLTTTCSGPGEVGKQFSNFKDPIGTAACTDTSGKVCAYSISQADGSAAAEVDDYQICFYLESGAGSLASGLHAIETNGVYGTCD